MDIRVSSGTASHLELIKSRSLEPPTTAYLLIPGAPCRGGCVYCPQASSDGKWLSRVSWPSFRMDDILNPLEKSDLQRICIQSPDVDGYEEKVIHAVRTLETTGKPVSVSAPPLPEDVLKELKTCSVDRMGVGIDGVTDELRSRTKRGYDPMIFWDYLGDTIQVFGEGRVTAHMIVGLGEELEHVGHAVHRASRIGANVSLFPYMFGKKEVDIRYYRKAQLLSYLIARGHGVHEAISLTHSYPHEVREYVESGEPFRTAGCPGCNRPYYTTRPGKEHRNYPREPTWDEIRRIEADLRY